MSKDPNLLDAIQDEVSRDPNLYPVANKDGSLTTFCNIAVDRVASRYGCNGLHDAVTGIPFLATEMCAILLGSSDFSPVVMEDCQAMVNKGTLIFACMTAEKMGEKHGHIVTLTTGVGDYSGAWHTYVPLCLNVGMTVTRGRGINWAFPVEKGLPDFFAWKESL